MKDGLENSFKEALNNFELPYDARAWESLNQKLSAKKWYQAASIKWSAVLVIAIGITAYFVLPTAKTNNQKEVQAKTIQKETKSAATPSKTEQQTSNNTKQKTELLTVTSMDPEVILSSNSNDNVTELILHSIPKIFNQMDLLGLTDQAIPNEEPTPSYTGGVAIIDFKNRCQGETLQLEADKRNERMISYAGKELHFSYNEAISLKLTEPGKVTLTANTGPYGQFEEFGSFEVSATPTLNINSDRTLNYEDGLPKINIQGESSEGQITWHSTYMLSDIVGKNTEILAFEKGFAIIEAQVTSANGCKTKEKETEKTK